MENSDCAEFNQKVYSMPQSAEMRVLLGSAAGTIENLLGQVDALEAELRDERHRHDRYVDFELAEAEELRKLKEQLRWIPVTERLPSIHADVLLYFKDDDNMVAGYLDDVGEDRSMWCAYSDGGYWTDCDYEPTHWMPLPNPPEGE